jgi:hypothetical protein
MEKTQEAEKIVVDKSIIQIFEKALKETKNHGNISDADVKKQVSEHIEFLKFIENIDISADSYRVILTFGQDELVYDDGEFYLVDTIDVSKKKKKLTKKQARDMYIEYFIRYQLNPILENKKVKNMVKELSSEKREERKVSKKTEKAKENKVEEKKKAITKAKEDKTKER